MRKSFFEYLIQKVSLMDVNQKDEESLTKKEDWYQSKEKFLQKNKLFLEAIVADIPDDLKEKYTTQELFYMQKLYLLYPDHPPKQLLSLSWDHIKILLEIFDVKKRNFYVMVCLYKGWTSVELVQYIEKDLYEKACFLAQKTGEEDLINSENFINKVLKIESVLWL